jgi:hypothetical protein
VRPASDVAAQAARAGGLELVGTEVVPFGGELAVASHWRFRDPWAAARMLAEGAEDDTSDPVVRDWALAILAAVRAELGEPGPTMTPAVADLFAATIAANVQSAIAFVHERKETFQSARMTMARGAGDCDDHARLVYALAGAGGLPVQLVFLTVPEDGRQVPAHVVTQIGTSAGPMWAETTIPACFGEHPLDALDRISADLPAERNPMAQPPRPMPLAQVPMGFLGLDFVTPQDVRDRKGELAALVTSIDADVVACAAAPGSKLPTAKLDAWNQFVAEFRSFMQDDPGVFSAGGQGRLTAEYADRIRAWQLDLDGYGCSSSAPTLPEAKDEPIVGTIKTVAVAAAVVAGVFGLWEVAQFIPKPRRRAA